MKEIKIAVMMAVLAIEFRRIENNNGWDTVEMHYSLLVAPTGSIF